MPACDAHSSPGNFKMLGNKFDHSFVGAVSLCRLFDRNFKMILRDLNKTLSLCLRMDTHFYIHASTLPYTLLLQAKSCLLIAKR